VKELNKPTLLLVLRTDTRLTGVTLFQMLKATFRRKICLYFLDCAVD